MRKRSGWNTWTRRFGFGFVLLVLLIVAWTWRCVIHLNWARPELLERYPSGSKAIIIVFHILLLPLLASYLRCVFTETGYEDDEDDIQLGLVLPSQSVLSRAQQLRLHEVGPDGLPRICQICQVIKPDRSHHCSVCGQCVLKMDHHCPWLNNCVGHANQKLCVEVKVARMVGVIGREKLCAAGAYTYLMCSAMRGLFNILWSKEYFVLFLFWTFLELTFTVLVQGPEVLTCFEMTQTECSQELLFNEMLVLSFALSVGGFLAFHFYLALINRTTLELFEKPSPTAANPHTRFPYDLGWRRNLTQVFGPRPALWLIPTRSGCIADGLDWESTSPPPTPELSPA